MFSTPAMDHNSTENESLIARVQQLERERDDLHKDIEQLCLQKAGPAYLAVATRMHFQRTAALEQEVESLNKKLASCTREKQNLEEELSEAYRIKSQLADLLSAEVSKNAEAEKQLKFFQGCVAAAFSERDNAIMEAEKAKEKVELMPQELNLSRRKVEELTCQLIEEKGLSSSLRIDLENQEKQTEVFKEVINKFYDIRRCSTDNIIDASYEEKCQSLLHDSAEMWSFQDDEEACPSNYISSLEAEIETLRSRLDNMQNKLRVGLEIESHLKKKVRNLEKKEFFLGDKIKAHISELRNCHSEYRIHIRSLLDESSLELRSVYDLVVEKIREHELGREHNRESFLPVDPEIHESECKDVHVTTDTGQDSKVGEMSQRNDPGVPTPSTSEVGHHPEALAQALQEKVEALLLLSQQDERNLLERNVNAALRKRVEELQRNLLQVTNEKVKALMELAQLKQEWYMLQEKTNQDTGAQGKHFGEIQERQIPQDKDGKFKNFLKRNYLPHWAGGSHGNDADAHLNYEKPINYMEFARMKIENASLKESLGSMEHLLSSVRRLRISLLKLKNSVTSERASSGYLEDLDKINAEAKLVKTALSSSLPISWSADYDVSDILLKGITLEKIDLVSAAGFEMVELLIFAALILKDQFSHQNKGDALASLSSE